MFSCWISHCNQFFFKTVNGKTNAAINIIIIIIITLRPTKYCTWKTRIFQWRQKHRQSPRSQDRNNHQHNWMIDLHASPLMSLIYKVETGSEVADRFWEYLRDAEKTKKMQTSSILVQWQRSDKRLPVSCFAVFRNIASEGGKNRPRWQLLGKRELDPITHVFFKRSTITWNL